MLDQSRPADRDITALTWRPLTVEDVDPWYELVARFQSDEQAGERTRRSDLERMTRQSWVDLAADTLVAVDTDGSFRAAAWNVLRPGAVDTVAVTLNGGVDPSWHGQGVGRQLLEWQRTRATDQIAERRERDEAAAKLPARMGTFVEEQMTSRARLFEAAGFTTSRWFVELRRPLAGPYDVPDLASDGLRVRRLDEDDDDLSERVRVAHNEAFLDHWGSSPHDEEAWRTGVLEDEAYRPAQSFAIVDTSAAGEPVAAYVLNFEFEHDWQVQGFTEGYTVSIGVRRPWRGRGLARHLLALSARVFAQAGHPYATLDVDADNPTGAAGLYESVGYEPVLRAAYYSVAG